LPGAFGRVRHIATHLLAGELSIEPVCGEVVAPGRGPSEGRVQAILQRLVALELVEAGLDARGSHLLNLRTLKAAFCYQLLCLSGVGFAFNVATAPPDNTIETRSFIGIVGTRP